MLPHNALVVVADGHSATLFRNTAKHGLDLQDRKILTAEGLVRNWGEQKLDEAPRDADETAFAQALVGHLNDMVLKHQVDDIAIIADPSTLGEMRKGYHKELQARLRQEVPKTLTNADTAAIEQALT
ncbi:host attachment protein [Paracoccus sp. (in: a-proteobacteria)]|uniref:baeRF12 domain-containing protein n=1 Tax=Paracoccus sp. TaxID=267 RepID=UPI0026DF788B|nr:host attachment protein [Paracoccus sp. (in: a-proteobacteria)]MDO5648954.1 host attachment protein [Paracoccus sp. (in: a-proteobacteria)]